MVITSWKGLKETVDEILKKSEERHQLYADEGVAEFVICSNVENRKGL